MTDDIIKSFYSEPQRGGGLAVFNGSRRQIGGSFLSGLARFALPILKFIGGKVFNVAKNVASDVVINKKPIGSSIKSRALEEATDTILRGRGVKRSKSVNINKSKKCKHDIFSQ